MTSDLSELAYFICHARPVNVNSKLADPAKLALELHPKQASRTSSEHFFMVLCDLGPERRRSRCESELLVPFNRLSSKLISFNLRLALCHETNKICLWPLVAKKIIIN